MFLNNSLFFYCYNSWKLKLSSLLLLKSQIGKGQCIGYSMIYNQLLKFVGFDSCFLVANIDSAISYLS